MILSFIVKSLHFIPVVLASWGATKSRKILQKEDKVDKLSLFRLFKENKRIFLVLVLFIICLSYLVKVIVQGVNFDSKLVLSVETVLTGIIYLSVSKFK